MDNPYLISGNVAFDERGKVSFVNDFTFSDVKRFYMIQNHENYFVRAWQGHQNEAKYFTVLQGKALICAVKIDNWNTPSKELSVEEFVLTEEKPAVLCLPKGYANGMMNLTKDTKIVVFATTTLTETNADNYRWEPMYWNPWKQFIKESSWVK
jgi:dTDP-4-dehydrorhamnose 3,5-epimerase